MMLLWGHQIDSVILDVVFVIECLIMYLLFKLDGHYCL